MNESTSNSERKKFTRGIFVDPETGSPRRSAVFVGCLLVALFLTLLSRNSTDIQPAKMIVLGDKGNEFIGGAAEESVVPFEAASQRPPSTARRQVGAFGRHRFLILFLRKTNAR